MASGTSFLGQSDDSTVVPFGYKILQCTGDGNVSLLQTLVRDWLALHAFDTFDVHHNPVQDELEYAGENGDTALHRACRNGHVACLHVLLAEAGMDPNIANDDGDSPGHVAAHLGRLDCVQELHEHRIQWEALNKSGYRAEDLALDRGHVEVAQYIAKNYQDESVAAQEVYTQLCTFQEQAWQMRRILHGRDMCGTEGGRDFETPATVTIGPLAKRALVCAVTAKSLVPQWTQWALHTVLDARCTVLPVPACRSQQEGGAQSGAPKTDPCPQVDPHPTACRTQSTSGRVVRPIGSRNSIELPVGAQALISTAVAASGADCDDGNVPLDVPTWSDLQPRTVSFAAASDLHR